MYQFNFPFLSKLCTTRPSSDSERCPPESLVGQLHQHLSLSTSPVLNTSVSQPMAELHAFSASRHPARTPLSLEHLLSSLRGVGLTKGPIGVSDMFDISGRTRLEGACLPFPRSPLSLTPHIAKDMAPSSLAHSDEKKPYLPRRTVFSQETPQIVNIIVPHQDACRIPQKYTCAH